MGCKPLPLLPKIILIVGLLLLADPAAAAAHDPVAPVALQLTLVLTGALLAGFVATRLKQPAVMGELLFGVIVANLGLGFAVELRDSPAIDLLGRIGVLLLLFEVGLESSVRQLLRVGLSALLVATIGVATPLLLGWWVAAQLLPAGSSMFAPLFLGATLTATSVGITARVLQELGALDRPESRVILGAAVIDDVLGLMVLAVVAALVGAANAGESLAVGPIVLIIAKGLAFLAVSLALGVWATPWFFRWAARLRHPSTLLALGMGLCFGLAWAADAAGLAPLVGAFAAGLVLERAHSEPYRAQGERGLEELVHPIAQLFVPLFFVQIGLRTDLRALLQPGALGLSAALIAVAIVSKQACSLMVLQSKGPVDRLLVGFGMIPRGEVGLIFAGVGAGLHVAGQPVLGAAEYAAVVAMVLATTLLTPPLLQWRLRRLVRA